VDLAQAHMLALTSSVTGAFNLGTGHGYSVNQVVEIAREVTGRSIPVLMAERRAGDPARLIACADRAFNVLKWKPQYGDLRSIISSAWNWHKKHPNGYRR
jgi:UDP-glucose 4-epimerase